MIPVRLTINGHIVDAEIAPRTHLADFLRESQCLTGTHIGCEHGICGACTVEIDGQISRSCITFAVACDGASVRTIEGFNDDELMGQLRAAFTQEHALQCGYCTPGMLIAARDLIRRRGNLTEPEIRTEMSGNLCRCTGYTGIIRAIARVMADNLAVPQATQKNLWIGPAPGPSPGPSAHVPRATNAAAPEAQTPGAPSVTATHTLRRIDVKTSASHQVGAMTRLSQSFEIAAPIALVWSNMSRLETVVACMPGAQLDVGPAADGSFSANLALSLGPIRTTFAGDGLFARDDAVRSCRVEGRGRDRGGPSSVLGEINYQLAEISPTLTRIDADIGYALTGPLAQFGRPTLVHGLVTSIGETFASNLDAIVAARGLTQKTTADIRLASLIWSLVANWIRRLWGR